MSSKALGVKITNARNRTIIPTVLKNTFGLTLSNQDDFLEGISSSHFFNQRTDPKGQERHSHGVKKERTQLKKSPKKMIIQIKKGCSLLNVTIAN
jgi:hypothetical protein